METTTAPPKRSPLVPVPADEFFASLKPKPKPKPEPVTAASFDDPELRDTTADEAAMAWQDEYAKTQAPELKENLRRYAEWKQRRHRPLFSHADQVEEKQRALRSHETLRDWMVLDNDAGMDHIARRRGFIDRYEQAAQLIPRKALRPKVARDLFVQDITGATPEQLRTGIPQLQVAKEILRIDDPSDEAFDQAMHGYVRGLWTKHKRREKMAEQGARMAITKASHQDAWAITKGALAAEGLSAEDMEDSARTLYNAREHLQREFGEVIPLARRIFATVAEQEGVDPAGQRAFGSIDEAVAAFAEIPEKDFPKMIYSLHALAEEHGEDVDGFFKKMGASIERGFASYGVSFGGFLGGRKNATLRSMVERGEDIYIPIEDARTPEEAAYHVFRKLGRGLGIGPNGHHVDGPKPRRKLTPMERVIVTQYADHFDRAIAAQRVLNDYRGEIARVKSDNPFVQGIYDTTASLPYMAASALGPVGLLMNGTVYAEDNYRQLKASHPGADDATLRNIADLTAMPMAAIDRFGGGKMLGKFPGTQQLLASLAGGGLMKKLLVEQGKELGQEMIQESMLPIARELAERITGDANLQGSLRDDMVKLAEQSPRMFFATLPLSAIGTGGKAVADRFERNHLKALMADGKGMRALAFTDEEVAQINAIDALEDKVTRYQEIYRSKTPEQRAQAADAALKSPQQSSSLPVTHAQPGGGFQVSYPDGRTESVATGEEAITAETSWVDRHFEEARQVSEQAMHGPALPPDTASNSDRTDTTTTPPVAPEAEKVTRLPAPSFSIRGVQAVPFAENIGKALAGKLPANAILDLGRPGKILLDAGIPDLPFHIRQKKLGKKRRAHPELTQQVLEGLPAAIQDPVAVFISPGDGKAHGIITTIPTPQGPVTAYFALRNQFGETALEAKSIYGRQPYEVLTELKQAEAKGLISYTNKAAFEKWAAQAAGTANVAADQHTQVLEDLRELFAEDRPGQGEDSSHSMGPERLIDILSGKDSTTARQDVHAAFDEEMGRFGAARPGVTVTEAEQATLGDLVRRGRLTITQAWHRVRDYAAQTGTSLDGLTDTALDGFQIRGSADAGARFAHGVLDGAISLVKGEKDIGVLWEEHAETWIHAQLNGGQWTEATLLDELRRVERQTGKTFLAGEDRAHLVEGFSYVARNYAAGNFADLNFGTKLKHLLNLLAEKIAATFHLAQDLRRLSKDGQLTPELESALRESLGFEGTNATASATTSTTTSPDAAVDALADSEPTSSPDAASLDGAVDITPTFSISRAHAVEIRGAIEAQAPHIASATGIPDLSTHEEALAWMKKNGVFGKTTHPAVSGAIQISQGKSKQTTAQGLSKEKAAMMLILRDLVPNSIPMETSTLTSHMQARRFAHKIVIDGVPHLARIVIDEDSSGRRYYNHQLSDLRPLRSNHESEALQPDGPEFEDTDEFLRWMYGTEAYPANDPVHERTEPSASDPTQSWTPHKGFRAPKPSKGRFLGDRGNSEFQVSDKMADEMGVPRGTRVPWRIGTPDLLEWAVPGPENKIPKQFEVPGLTGDHDADKTAMVGYMAKRLGRTHKFIKNWLLENEVDLHHAGEISVQIVPDKIHKIPHSGGAQKLRQER
jgi:hypothetical protein